MWGGVAGGGATLVFPGLRSGRGGAWLTLGQMVLMGEVPRDTENLRGRHSCEILDTRTLPPLLLILPSRDIVGSCEGGRVGHGGAGPLYGEGGGGRHGGGC